MNAIHSQLKTLLNEHDVARITGMPVATVRRWRLLGQGPRYIKIGAAAVRYKPEDISAWLESRPTRRQPLGAVAMTALGSYKCYRNSSATGQRSWIYPCFTWEAGAGVPARLAVGPVEPSFNRSSTTAATTKLNARRYTMPRPSKRIRSQALPKPSCQATIEYTLSLMAMKSATTRAVSLNQNPFPSPIFIRLVRSNCTPWVVPRGRLGGS